jgi:hypothetical protein
MVNAKSRPRRWRERDLEPDMAAPFCQASLCARFSPVVLFSSLSVVLATDHRPRCWVVVLGDSMSDTSRRSEAEEGHMTMQARSGWPTFAGVLALVAGGYNTLSGIAAVAEDDRVAAINEVLFGVDITAWGWFWIIVGVVQIVTGILILMRNPIGQVLGVVFAAISAFFTVFLIFAFPFWAFTVLAVDLMIIYGLTAHGEEFV